MGLKHLFVPCLNRLIECGHRRAEVRVDQLHDISAINFEKVADRTCSLAHTTFGAKLKRKT